MKSGDIVTLKSGGPEMTVVYVYSADDTCKCCWFVNDMKYMDTFAQKAVDVKKQEEPLQLTENKTYQDKIDKYIVEEVDLKTKIQRLSIIIENRTKLIFNSIKNNTNFYHKNGHILTEYLELLVNLIEKINKLTEI
jgi:uncharacterized protein YodC (DUF2158 family)